MKPATPDLGRAAFGAAEHSLAASGHAVLHPRLADALRQAGLGSLEEALELRGEIVSEHRRTRVLRLDSTARLPEIYLKVHQAPDRKDVILAVSRHRERRSSAETEWRNLEDLAAAGIPTAIPLAMACRMGALREEVSFLATAALPGVTPLDQLLVGLPGAGRARVLVVVAETVARMHANGFTHPDLYARHVYVDEEASDCALLDVQRTRRRQRLRISHRARDLAALDVSLSPRVVSMTERLRFLARYRRQAGADGQPLRRRTVRRIARAVLRRRALLIQRGRGEEWKREEW